jgi:quercetin dioxygenase-like cupin family protein
VVHAGDEIGNPVTGEQFTVLRSTADTNGELMDGIISLAPRSPGPPAHVHPVIEERLKVVSGTLKVALRGEERTLREGDEVAITPGTPHRLWNDADEEVRFEAVIEPALRMETLIETLFGLGRDGKLNKTGRPSILQSAIILDEYSEEFRLAGVPAFLQRIVFGTLAPIGKLFGYKASYPEYSRDA